MRTWAVATAVVVALLATSANSQVLPGRHRTSLRESWPESPGGPGLVSGAFAVPGITDREGVAA